MTAPVPRRALMGRVAEWLGVSALFVLLTLWYTDPLWRHPGLSLADPGDPVHNACVSWWLSRLFLSGHLAGMWDLPPYFYPAHRTLAFDDPQIGVTLLGLPFYAASRNIVLAYNAVVLLSLPLCALGAYALARHVTGSRVGGLTAGLAWGFGAWHSGQAGHQQILSLECLPWAMLMLHRYAATGRTRFLVGLFVFWTAQEYLCEYWGAFLYLLVVPFALVLLRVCHGLSWRATLRGLSPIALAGLAWMPALWPYFALARHGQGHPAGMINAFSADLADYLPLWALSRGSRWGNEGEAALSPGLIVLALAVGVMARLLRVRERAETPPTARAERAWVWIAARMPMLLILLLFLRGLMWALGVPDLQYYSFPRDIVNADTVTRAFLLALLLWVNVPLRAWWRRHRWSLRDRHTPMIAYAFLALLAMVWSCGYQVYAFNIWLFPGLHGFVTWLPGMRSFRVLMRMGVFADLALSVLAAWAVSRVMRRWRAAGATPWQRGLATALLGALILADNVPRGGTAFAQSRACLPPPRAVDRWLASQPPGPLVELPLTGADVARMWFQTQNRKPMVNGYATFSPAGYEEEKADLSSPWTPACLARLRALGIRYIVLDVGTPPPVGHSPYRKCYADSQVTVYVLTAASEQR